MIFFISDVLEDLLPREGLCLHLQVAKGVETLKDCRDGRFASGVEHLR